MKLSSLVVLLCVFFATMFDAPVASAKKDDSRFQSKTFAGLKLRSIGPALMSGRIADIAIHPERNSTWYVAVGSGGVWRTTNSGTTWQPIFDNEGSYSIGCLTLDPNRPETIWVGTGENVGGRHVGYGDGLYRSLDGGNSWEKRGLEESEHIGTILVDPRNSDVVWVAAQGPLWSKGGERGLYQTTDAGETWKKHLGDDEYTGVNEVVMDPRDPDVLYAATHQRYRNVAALINGGPGSGIHKTTDGGATWRELVTGLPGSPGSKAEEEDMGKIGLAISPQNSSVVYATIEQAHRKGGFYRSTDGGESWEKRNDFISGGTGPHYYQEIFASPHQFDRVYQVDVRLRVTEDGGKTFRRVPHEHKHSDDHALAFVASDPNYLLSGVDGGLYESWDLGETWKFVSNLPLTQFYKVAIDYDEPFYNVYGGTQDNNTQGGPSRTTNVHGIRNSDWKIVLFGDGHQPAVDPTNPDIIYAEWQRGNLCRFDRKNGEIVYIQPQPGPGEPWDRFNWDSPILLSPHDPKVLYFASQRVWRSPDRGDSWAPISGDLTRDLHRLELPMMDRTWSFDAVWDLYAMSEYSTITSLSESPVQPDLLYVGTDDGLIQVSENGGGSWRKVDKLPGVDKGFFVNDIKADLHDADVAYVAVDQHKNGDFSPYLYRSTDRGKSWKNLAGDLPERHLVWRLVQDHVDPRLLFVGTEFGVFFTVNGGKNWIELTGGVPNIPFRDLAIQQRENDLVGATFGRGFYILDDYTPLRGLTEETLAQEVELFPVKDALWYIPQSPLGGGVKASQGDAFFVAENPPFGAIFTYYLSETLETRKDQRRESEKELAGEGRDVTWPGWDALRAEELEEDPEMLFTVRDSEGNVVRRVTGPAKKGFHRVAWDLRYPSPQAYSTEPSRWEAWVRGLLAPPGEYTVSVAMRVDGIVTDLGKSETFQVRSIREEAIPGASHQELAAFTRTLDATRRDFSAADSTIASVLARVKAIQGALMNSTADSHVHDDAREFERRLEALRETLNGNARRNRANHPGPISLSRRLGVAVMGNLFSAHGPTATHLESLEIARNGFATLARELDGILNQELPEFERQLDLAGVPWTPGRGVGGGE